MRSEAAWSCWVIILIFNQEGILNSFPCFASGSHAREIELPAKVASSERTVVDRKENVQHPGRVETFTTRLRRNVRNRQLPWKNMHLQLHTCLCWGSSSQALGSPAPCPRSRWAGTHTPLVLWRAGDTGWAASSEGRTWSSLQTPDTALACAQKNNPAEEKQNKESKTMYIVQKLLLVLPFKNRMTHEKYTMFILVKMLGFEILNILMIFI